MGRTHTVVRHLGATGVYFGVRAAGNVGFDLSNGPALPVLFVQDVGTPGGVGHPHGVDGQPVCVRYHWHGDVGLLRAARPIVVAEFGALRTTRCLEREHWPVVCLLHDVCFALFVLFLVGPFRCGVSTIFDPSRPIVCRIEGRNGLVEPRVSTNHQRQTLSNTLQQCPRDLRTGRQSVPTVPFDTTPVLQICQRGSVWCVGGGCGWCGGDPRHLCVVFVCVVDFELCLFSQVDRTGSRTEGKKGKAGIERPGFFVVSASAGGGGGRVLLQPRQPQPPQQRAPVRGSFVGAK